MKLSLVPGLKKWKLDLNLPIKSENIFCLLYTSDAADERSSVDLGGRRIIKKKKKRHRERQEENKEREK